MRVLAFDPGKHHFAWALLEGHSVDGGTTLIGRGLVQQLLERIGDPNDQLRRLKREFKALFRMANLDPKTDYICIERFMHRPGQGRGAVGEFINLQIGLLVAWAPVEVYLITPSAWKNHMKRHYGTNESLKLFDPDGANGYVVHEADAMGIATYCFESDWKQRLLQRVA